MSFKNNELKSFSPLIAALRDPACYPHAVQDIDILQTHISWVILTGTHVYKIKKPVNLGFLDFSTLEARHHYCAEELRLNRRFAPSIYEAVVKVTGSIDQPRMDGTGDVIEYAVRMRQFAQSDLASRMLADGALAGAHIDAFAEYLAAFHAQTEITDGGAADAVMAPARENFAQLLRLLPDAADQSAIAELQAWTEREYASLETEFSARRAQGCVRECHGDLHLGNIVMIDGRLVPFDCIEFDPALRRIDVMNEIAFLVMDLLDRGRGDLAYRFLNAYLECSGDYAGLAVLRFYVVYRAMVRAKVHGLRALQEDAAGQGRLRDAAREYVVLAQRCIREQSPAVILMHGLSGSGKSVIAQALACDTGAIRLRSDVERKRLHGLDRAARSGSTLASGIYSEDATNVTYSRLLDLVRTVTAAGYAAMVDAAFLQRRQRDLFRCEALARGLPFIIADVTAPEPVLRARIAARAAAGSDASEADRAVLAYQIAHGETLTGEELAAVLPVDTSAGDAEAVARAACRALRARLEALAPRDA